MPYFADGNQFIKSDRAGDFTPNHYLFPGLVAVRLEGGMGAAKSVVARRVFGKHNNNTSGIIMKKRHGNSRGYEDMDFGTASCSTVLRMYSDFRHQAADVYGHVNGAPLNVAIAYEDSSAGIHVLQTFQGLFDADRRPFHFDMRNAWKFDYLRLTDLREAAIAETVRADLIIVSMHAATELPATVKWWMETALERREGDPGALVLLCDGNHLDGSNPSLAEAYLTNCARKGGLDFFVKRAAPRHDSKQTPFDRGSEEIVGVPVRAGRPTRPTFDRRRFSAAFWE